MPRGCSAGFKSSRALQASACESTGDIISSDISEDIKARELLLVGLESEAEQVKLEISTLKAKKQASEAQAGESNSSHASSTSGRKPPTHCRPLFPCPCSPEKTTCDDIGIAPVAL